MADLSDFKRGQIVGARLASACITKTAKLFRVARSNLLKVMTALEKEGKTSSLKQNSGRKRNLSDSDPRTLTWIVWQDHKNTASKITAKFNDHLEEVLWCNGYRRRKWTRRHEFKFWTRLIAFHIALIPLGKVWIQLFSLQLWINSCLGEATSLGAGKLWIQTC